MLHGYLESEPPDEGALLYLIKRCRGLTAPHGIWSWISGRPSVGDALALSATPAALLGAQDG